LTKWPQQTKYVFLHISESSEDAKDVSKLWPLQFREESALIKITRLKIKGPGKKAIFSFQQG